MTITAILMLALQIGFAVHAGKTGRPFFWIYLIIFLPGIGILAYAAVELVPGFFRSYRGQKTTRAVGRLVDPGKGYRALARDVEVAPTVDNMLRLAREGAALGRFDEAIDLYHRCLQGMHATDPDILLGLAEAEFGAGQAPAAKATLDQLHETNPDYQSDEGHLLYARTLEATGDLAGARAEYEALIDHYPGPEAKCRYGLLLQKQGERERAAAVFAEVKKALDNAPRHMRRRYAEWHAMARDNARA
jgi:hypothetical protein